MKEAAVSRRTAGGGAALADVMEGGERTPREKEEAKVHNDMSCSAWGCKLLTVFMCVFVGGDIAKQLLFPSMTFIDTSASAASLSASLSSAGSQLSRAASAVAATLGSGEADGPVGAAATLAANGTLAAPWGARTSGGAALDALSVSFPAPVLNNSALLASGRAMAELRAHPALPAIVLHAAGVATASAPPPAAAEAAVVPAALTDGTVLVLRLRVAKGTADAVRGVELSLGSSAAAAASNDADVSASASAGPKVHWSEGALLHTLAPGLLTAPEAFTEALLPVPPRRGGAAWTHVRLRYVACDKWGHALGDVDCDASAPPQPLSLQLDAVSLRPATAAARAAATKRLCEPALLMEGRGLSCLLPDVCPMNALYTPLILPADKKYSGLAAAGGSGGVLGGTRLLPSGALAGEAQGFRCADVAARVTLGCKLARGWSTHKAVYRGLYHPPGGAAPVPVVVKEGGVRYPAPYAGERGVGFAPDQDAYTQRAALQTMFFEMVQEIHMAELLAGHPGIPRQLGACVDADSLLATSVQAMGGVHIGTKADLVALARAAASPAAAALKLARSAVSLFEYLVETRYLRLEDLHWQVFDLRGNVRTNFTDLNGGGGAYAADDLSQFSVDSADPETGLNLMLIDLDKMLISHDEELRWYVAEQMMPYVAAQLLTPLAELLPGLQTGVARMLAPDPLQRPPSFACLREWLAPQDAATWLASRQPAEWRELPCDPAVYNAGLRSRWENPHFGRK